MSVCLSVTAILPPRTIRRLTRGTSGYSATCTRLLKRCFLYKCFVKKLGRYLLTAKKSAIFTLVRMCEAILNIDTHDVMLLTYIGRMLSEPTVDWLVGGAAVLTKLIYVRLSAYSNCGAFMMNTVVITQYGSTVYIGIVQHYSQT